MSARMKRKRQQCVVWVTAVSMPCSKKITRNLPAAEHVGLSQLKQGKMHTMGHSGVSQQEGFKRIWAWAGWSLGGFKEVGLCYELYAVMMWGYCCDRAS